MNKTYAMRFLAVLVAIGVPLFVAHPALASDANVAQVESFIRSIIKVVAGLAGLVAAGFFCVRRLRLHY